MLTGKAVAQSVTVDATIDSLQIYIGDQAKIKLQVAWMPINGLFSLFIRIHW